MSIHSRVKFINQVFIHQINSYKVIIFIWNSFQSRTVLLGNSIYCCVVMTSAWRRLKRFYDLLKCKQTASRTTLSYLLERVTGRRQYWVLNQYKDTHSWKRMTSIMNGFLHHADGNVDHVGIKNPKSQPLPPPPLFKKCFIKNAFFFYVRYMIKM